MVARAFDPDALWMKAKLFVNHALEEGNSRTFDERALWAALALEVLAKAALARFSPVLIANPTENGTNVLIASGLLTGDAIFESIKAHTLYSRCAKAFRPFNDDEAKKITQARNDYLHGSAAVFTNIPEKAWWPRYWAQVVVLVHAQDKDLTDLVGSSHAHLVEQQLAQNKRNIEHQLEMRLERAKQRLAQYRSGDLSARAANEWRRYKHQFGGLRYYDDAKCPACGENGIIEGDNIEDAERREGTHFNDHEPWVALTITTEYFSCETCHLVLDDWELLAEAGLELSFETTGDYDDYAGLVGPEYGND